MQLNHFQLQLRKIQAKLFALAYGTGYDPLRFVPASMASAAAEELEKGAPRDDISAEMAIEDLKNLNSKEETPT